MKYTIYWVFTSGKKPFTFIMLLISTLKPNYMKRILLFLTALLFTYMSQAQVPANDLIENAIFIDPTNYNEENIRLDLATDSGGAAMGCSTTGFNNVYYKFTATSDVTVTSSITDMSGGAIGQSFVVYYTAPNLLQTDESQLNAVSACTTGTSAQVTLVTGQDYYISVHRLDAGSLSRFSSNIPPPNDNIADAIEITEQSYGDSDVRIDLAQPNPGGQLNCSLAGFPTVYYKFTAQTNGQASVFLSSNPVGNTFAIFYTAANLNATNDSELTLASTCAFGGQTTSFNVFQGQSYYILIHNDAPNVPTFVSISTPQDGTPEERQALIDLYNATDGANWAFNDNWTTAAPLSEWTNVTVNGGHVRSVILNNNSATGTLPSSLSDLTFLEQFSMGSNNLFGVVPDLSVIPTLDILDLNLNNFSVGDLLVNFTNNSTIPNFAYNAQTTLDPSEEVEPGIGNDYTLSVTPDTDVNANYQWYKSRNSPIDNILIDGATNPNYALTNIQSDDLDTYICEITSSSIPDLTITRLPINLTGPISQQELDALTAFYNALDGDNWTDNTNWLSSEPVGTWSFITTRGNKVISINIFGDAGLNGQLPTEIGDLTHLEMLSIGLEQGVFGELPESIGNLTELQRLRLQLTNNTGSIPATIGNLSNLWELRIVATGMTGELPASIGNLTNLTDITMFGERVFTGNGQSFNGNIPDSFGNLVNLDKLDLQGNNFSGSVPSSLSNLTNLGQLSLNDNELSGPLPDFSGNVNPNRGITLENNYFTFSNLAPLVTNGLEYQYLNYSPQRTLDQEETIDSPPGVDITLDINESSSDRVANEDAQGNGNQYQWFKDNEPIAGANATTYTIVNAQMSDSGVYYCEITNPLLPDLIIRRANITVNVDESLSITEESSNVFSIYPNPVSNWLTINLGNHPDAKLTIHDVNGKLILERTISSNLQLIDVSQLQSGMYITTLSSTDKTETKRLIKH